MEVLLLLSNVLSHWACPPRTGGICAIISQLFCPDPVTHGSLREQLLYSDPGSIRFGVSERSHAQDTRSETWCSGAPKGLALRECPAPGAQWTVSGDG
jgi:hypothetical protein